MYASSSDLELIYDGGSNQGLNQTVGLRFVGVNIPKGAVITKAYVQFTVDESSSGGTSLTIEGELSDSADPFVAANGNISGRRRTASSVGWSPASWSAAGESGSDQRTPDLSAVIQEIVSQGGWIKGNALAVIITGSGTRTAESFEGNAASAPVLHVEFTGEVGAEIERFTVDPESAFQDETVTFSWSVEPNGQDVDCELDVDGDGIAEDTVIGCAGSYTRTHSYQDTGTYQAELRVVGDSGVVTRAEASVFVTSPPSSDSILWVADHETGDLRQWSRITISDQADAQISTAVARSGSYSNALTIYNADGTRSSSPGVRMGLWEYPDGPSHQDVTHPENLPTEGYYSTYYYFPQAVDNTWWLLFQWKSAMVDEWDADGNPTHQTRKLLYYVWADYHDDGTMTFRLRSRVGDDGEWIAPGYNVAYSNKPIPVQQWVHFECYYKWSKQKDGRITCWQDGVLLWDVSGIQTEYDYDYIGKPRQWTVNNYANETMPRTVTIYIDDAALSLDRIGPNAPGSLYLKYRDSSVMNE